MSQVNADWSQEVLHFWFEELSPKDWFVASEKVDASISSRFAALHDALSGNQKLPVDATQPSVLAAIIVLDQFSRNLFRGTKDAFAYDSSALALAKQAMQHEVDKTLSDDEKQFLYMPFMHAENLADQQTCVTLFTGLGKPEHAIEHLVIIEKFGRFPHRNDVLERESTSAEIEYLQDAKRFGQ